MSSLNKEKHFRHTQIVTKAFVASLTTFIVSNIKSCQPIIKKIDRIGFSTIVITQDGKQRSLSKDNQCPVCKGLTFNKKLELICHLEIAHWNIFTIEKYEWQGTSINLHIVSKVTPMNNFIRQDTIHKYLLTDTGDDRMKSICNRIFFKFIKKTEQKKQNVYYHSFDIFRQVGSSSEDIDSQEDACYLERQLERCRINEFVDINDMEKLFFQEWNLLVHDHVKTNKVIQNHEIVSLLNTFAPMCKKKGISRSMLFTHAWTLWTFGQLTPQAIIHCLDIYDNSNV